MNGLDDSRIRAGTILGILAMILTCGCGNDSSRDYQAETFATLQNIRVEKEAALTDYFHHLHDLTNMASTDTLLGGLFDKFKNGDPLTLYTADLENQIDLHFVNTYGDFYDLLWVDTSGFVIHSIRRESDYRTCLFDDSSSVQLSRRLRLIREPAFIDFENYSPSDEPGAFHVVPVFRNDEFTGWLIFQQAINRINTILTDRQNMGRTGEIYLVNSNNLMLSQSRFTRESTILNRKVETEAIRTASSSESGSLLIEDYRGVRVFSSFSRLDILGTRWYILAEIDEAEVLTAHYAANKDALRRPVLDILRQNQTYVDAAAYPVISAIKVDMGEYGFTRPGRKLGTRGVATCTGVAVTFPGRFAYLAHVAPIDEAYTSTFLDLFDQSDKTDLITRLLNRIRQYDIYPYELDNLEVVLIATHDESYWNIIDQLVDFGISLNQIKLLYKPDAEYANVWILADAATVTVEWIMDNSDRPLIQTSRTIPDLGKLVKQLAS